MTEVGLGLVSCGDMGERLITSTHEIAEAAVISSRQGRRISLPL